MKIAYPFPQTAISQRFGDNANPLYAGQGLKGHTSIDFDVAWGTPVKLGVDGYCYSVMNKDNPNPGKFRAVYFMVDDGDFSYEVSYGHASEIFAVAGRNYKAGETIMLVGNTGDVYAGGVAVTVAERLAGSKAGSHLHGPQIRKCIRVKKTTAGRQYITDANGKLKINGFLYEVVEYNNGYNGCVNPDQFFVGQNTSASFTHDLFLGVTDPDVTYLQKFLNTHGFKVSESGAGSPGMETSFYGPKTVAAVSSFQKANGIAPSVGYFGAKTRSIINKIIQP